ncbi:hypothetical protein GJ700_11860 [Duganella sp. FT92W]|uniref:Uncharacterized protein n=1 Tax=Pseudoduganella rivuli TaxID=2666085 RepID=A0A7X2LRF6_9BURK|nr:hypothetical protein [Pseudoduganella rivuli]MRV72405.1 hypothetical protein [Pseudoduganella rivuli]
MSGLFSPAKEESVIVPDLASQAQGKECQGIRATRAGVVVGLGLINPHIAEEYARHTSRAFVNAASVAALADIADIAVVLVHADNLAAELYEYLYDGASTPAPGIIFASSEAELALVSQRLAKSLLPLSKPEANRACVSIFREIDSENAPYDLVADRYSSFEETCGVLSSDVEFLTLEGHGNGLHLAAPGGTTLCPMSTRLKARSALKPYCLEKQCCTNLHHLPSLENAWTSNRLINVERVNARVVFYDSCFAFRVVDHVVSPGYSLACSLGERSNVLNIIGSWQITLGDEQVDEFIAAGLEVGEEIGAVISRFNRLDEKRRHGRRLALFGDPAYRSYTGQASQHVCQ